mgnify:CR=1 FL=1
MFIPLIRHLGVKWVAQRTHLALARKSGWLARQTPCLPWASFGPRSQELSNFAKAWRESAPRLPITSLDETFVRPLLSNYAESSGQSVLAEAEALKAGRVKIFSGPTQALGHPPDWFLNVLSGQRVEIKSHWSKISDENTLDIKGVWEVSRFSWAYTLGRAWLQTGEAVYAEIFWQWFEDWLAKNPPNQGVHWMCGQEAAMRLIAFTWTLNVFRRHPVTTDHRLGLAAAFVEATAKRIEAHIAYAVSQQNNHGLSEALGLLTAGTYWPHLPQAQQWKAQGLQLFEKQALELIGSDGSFSQHSTNYHRLLLQLLSWAEITRRTETQTLSAPVKQAAQRAVYFLKNLMQNDGTVPRYGADDGANLFPLAPAEYHDFRPALGVALALFTGERLDPGPWDEAVLLLIGNCPSSATPRLIPESFTTPSVSLIRHGATAVFFHHPRFAQHRPSQADQLQISIRHEGRWLAEDVGTYSYHDPRFAGAGWAGAKFHNGVTIDDREPMDRVGRFLWLPWRSCEAYAEQPEAYYLDYPDGERWARAVVKLAKGFVVIDRITATRQVHAALRWHGREKSDLAQLQVSATESFQESWLTQDLKTDLGWFAPWYGTRQPSWVRTFEAEGTKIFFVTVIGPASVKVNSECVTIDTQSLSLIGDPQHAPVDFL